MQYLYSKALEEKLLRIDFHSINYTIKYLITIYFRTAMLVKSQKAEIF